MSAVGAAVGEASPYAAWAGTATGTAARAASCRAEGPRRPQRPRPPRADLRSRCRALAGRAAGALAGAVALAAWAGRPVGPHGAALSGVGAGIGAPPLGRARPNAPWCGAPRQGAARWRGGCATPRRAAPALVDTAAAAGLAPALEVPLRVMPLPERIIGRGYYLVQLSVRKDHFLTMLLDTGYTYAVMLVSSAAERLGDSVSKEGGAREGIGATGSLWMESIQLLGAEIRASEGARPWPLRPMSGVIVDELVQRKLAEEVGVQLDGMLGQGFLEQCDMEFDPVRGTLRAWAPGLLPRVALGWTELFVLNMPGDLQGLLLHLPGSLEPVVGFVDTGASHTVVNEAAAQALGLRAALEAEAAGSGARKVVRGIGLDGSALEMPLLNVSGASLCSAAEVSIVRLAPPPGSVGAPRAYCFGNTDPPSGGCVGPLRDIELAIGDIRFFEEMLTQDQDSIGIFRGPAALLGQDLLSQLPLRLSTRNRRLWFKHEPYSPVAPSSKL